MAVYLEKGDTAMSYSVLAWMLQSVDNNLLSPSTNATIADWINSVGGWVSNIFNFYLALLHL